MLLAAFGLFVNAEVFTSENLTATKGKQVKGNLEPETYYIISGITNLLQTGQFCYLKSRNVKILKKHLYRYKRLYLLQ